MYSLSTSSPEINLKLSAGTKVSNVPARPHMEQLQEMTGWLKSSSTS